ncbi:MAG: hypothetical protein J0L50_10980, partial [Sphingomonadales bacterium]|nr:hypothetical protein [Sphingomonadales bacterium]
SVVAERPELAALLSLHMNSLTAALQAQGLSVAHAEVRSRSSRALPRRNRGPRPASLRLLPRPHRPRPSPR